MKGSNVIEWEEKHCSRLRQEFLKYGGFIDWNLDVDLSCDETLLDNPSYQCFVIADMCENDWNGDEEKAGFPSHALNGKD